MDESVRRALEQWPNVPDCYGWLSLDRRGRWRLRGDILDRSNLVDFIGRNYLQMVDGSYVFQNGPQTVRVELEYLPYVFRYLDGGFVAHTGQALARLEAAYVDEQGSLILQTDLGAGELFDQDLVAAVELLRDQDGAALTDEAMAEALEALMQGEEAAVSLHWQACVVPLRPLHSEQVAQQLGFVPKPRPTATKSKS